MPEIVSVNISSEKGVAKLPVGSRALVENYGLEGDAHSGSHHRQISLLAVESIEKMAASTGAELPPGSFAENITTRGIVLYELPIGKRFTLGDCLLEVTQIGKECHQGCAISKLAGTCVMPKEGIFARVLKGGVISDGDAMNILTE